MRAGRAWILPVGLIGAGLLLGQLAWRTVARRVAQPVTTAAFAAGRVTEGQVVSLERVALDLSRSMQVPELERATPVAGRYHRWSWAWAPSDDPADAQAADRFLVHYWRNDFPGSAERSGRLLTGLRGTVRTLAEADRAKLAERMGEPVPRYYLDDFQFPQVGTWVALLVMLALASIGGGVFLLVRDAQPRRAMAPQPVRRPGLPPVARPERTRTCVACAAESPISSRACLACKAPIEVEYWVAAALPFEGFERHVPILARTLEVSEYQAREPMARMHTPIPYSHLQSFSARGPGAASPFRLVSRGIPSLVTARAVVAALEENGTKAVVVSSEDLLGGPFPRPATGLSYDADGITLVFEAAGERDERRIPWSRIGLVLFSADQPLRGTMTLARDLREHGPADPSAYLIDIYERGQPDGVRIAEAWFHRWEFLKLAGSQRPGDRYGKLMELLESNAPGAEFQYLTGVYRGPQSPWRVNFYSRLAWLAGERSGWAHREGLPRLEGYEILEKIGEGGMGSVYKARQKRLGRLVALKVIAPHLASQEKYVARFLAEGRAVAALSHPGIVQVIDLAESAGRHYMAMEFVEGKTLLKVIRERGHLEEAETLRIGRQMLDALNHAAERGIIHRDVKPDNVFLTPTGQAKLGDWGLAKDVTQDLGLTDTGTALGTPYYMSPEQARGRRDLDARSDLYSLGATLFHALTGTPPYRGSSPAEVVLQHLQAPVPDARVRAPLIRDETAEILRRLMQKRPDDRYASGAEALRELDRVLAAVSADSAVLT